MSPQNSPDMDRRLMLGALGGLAGFAGLGLLPGTTEAAQNEQRDRKSLGKVILHFTVELDANAVKDAKRVPCNIKVSNQSAAQIAVVMDTNREGDEMTTKGGQKIRGRRIVGAGSAVFHPNVGDNPTYHVWTTDGDTPDREIYAESFSTVWFNPFPHTCGDIKWTGAKLERD